MKLILIKSAAVKRLAKSNGRRVSNAYLLLLEEHVRRKVGEACSVHNGGRVTIDESIGIHTLLK